MPAEEEFDIQSEAEKVSEESDVHDPVRHPFKYPTDRVSNINKTLQQKVNDLLSQISVGNKVRFGSTSQKGTKKKAVPVQDREKDKEGEYTTSTI